MRRTASLMAVAAALATTGLAAARVADDLSIPQAHALARQYAPDMLLPTKLPTGVSRVAYLQGMTFTPGIKPADLGMQFHGGRTAPQFQLFFWRGRLRSAIVRAMTVTYTNKQSKYLTHAFTAGRFAGTRISYLILGSTANIVDDYIWESAGKTFVLSVIVKRLGKTMNPWSKTPVIASFRAP